MLVLRPATGELRALALTDLLFTQALPAIDSANPDSAARQLIAWLAAFAPPASAAARASQAETERQRAYLEAVLERLSSGVVTVDEEGMVRTANEAAGAILAIDLARLRDAPLSTLPEIAPRLAAFVDTIARQLASGARAWRAEVALPDPKPGKTQLLMLRAASIPVAAG
jgi:PAS domain-containing protein